MKVFLKKKFKQFNAGSDIIVSFEKATELINKGVASVDPVELIEEEKDEPKEEKKTIKTTNKKSK